MVKIKNIILFALMLIITFTFSGCASVRAMVITNLDNTIDETVTIELDEVAISTSGNNIQAVKENVLATAIIEAEEMKKYLNIKIETQIMLGVTNETLEILNSFRNGVEVVKSNWQENSLTVGVRFKNIDVYRYYYGIDAKSNIEYEKEEHFFYTKMYYQAYTMYVRHSDLCNKMYSKFSSEYPNLINSPTNKLLYTYTTESRREHSNADYLNNINGVYYHTWIVDGENITEPITIYYNVANAGNCILVCVLFTLILLLILLTISLITNLIKRKNKKYIKNIENNNKNQENN